MITYHNSKELNFDFERLLRMGYCWGGHEVSYNISASSVTRYLTGQLDPRPEDVKKVRALLIKHFGAKLNAIKFKLPEIITWCGCEPQCKSFHKEREAAWDQCIIKDNQ